ncbi:hypothetical protein AA0472_0781 [Acetobacter estunensis NRIC 0472]|nr:hypothetical protein AA0472_0781 [Acetobacter estunensis NRIC 0472]
MLWRVGGVALLAGMMATPVLAQSLPGGGEDDKKSAPDMQALSKHFNAMRVRKDYSYIQRPVGDKVVEQPDIDRLMFWTKDGRPDGYAQRRGDSVIYYDAGGRAVRVQHLAPGQAD